MTMMCNCSDEMIRRQIEALENASENNNDAGDATWILTSAFIIFTMQSGFGLLESGSCSQKNGCNIMIKNAVDVIFGALGYYICGFGFSFGKNKKYANGFTGFGDFFPDGSDKNDGGWLFARYFFQLSFATTATTIVSGAMAERTNLKAYMLFSFLNFLSYVFPAHWIWDDIGFLKKMGVVDIAGCGPVHVVGGVSALLATILLRPRIGVFDVTNPKLYHRGSPTNVVLGTFMLWWGWLGFNCGSTFGVSGGKWMLASKAAVNTVNGSVGGALFSIIYSYYLTKEYRGKLDIGVFTCGILGGLVSITAICAICRPWEALIIGLIGGIISTYGTRLIRFLHVDDPVSCIPVHLFCGMWGMLAVGLFGEEETVEKLSRLNGLFKGGNAEFLGIQLLAILCIASWSAATTYIELLLSDKIFGLRMSEEHEILGADIIEHGIHFDNIDPDAEIQNEKDRKISNALGKRSTIRRETGVSHYYSEGTINIGFVSYNEVATDVHRNIDKTIDEEDCEGSNSNISCQSTGTPKKKISKSISQPPEKLSKLKRKSSRFEVFGLRRGDSMMM